MKWSDLTPLERLRAYVDEQNSRRTGRVTKSVTLDLADIESVVAELEAIPEPDRYEQTGE